MRDVVQWNWLNQSLPRITACNQLHLVPKVKMELALLYFYMKDITWDKHKRVAPSLILQGRLRCTVRTFKSSRFAGLGASYGRECI